MSGYLVPQSVADEIEAVMACPNPYYRMPSWEERLATAIELRSIRFRLCVAWYTARYRLTTAIDVLRGTHDCGDD